MWSSSNTTDLIHLSTSETTVKMTKVIKTKRMVLVSTATDSQVLRA